MPEPEAPEAKRERAAAARLASEQALLKTIAEQAARLRELEQFAYVVSHDLQAPLRSILGFSQLLSRRHKEQLSGEALEFLGYMEQSAQQAQSLIQDLLKLSRIGRGERHIEIRPLADSVGNALKRVGDKLQASAAAIEYAQLPEISPEISTDHGLLAQLLEQLIDNAIKFHRPGERPSVTISAEREGPDFRITVRDQGIGIPPDQLENVFIVFRRLHGADDFPGNGMGLTLARKIATLLGGTLRAAADSSGTQLVLRLPIEQGAVRADT